MILDRMEPPAQRLEHDLQPWTTYLILPIFALANAGVVLSSGTGMNLGNGVSLGIIVGLVVGKPLGVSLFAWIATRLGLAEMPSDISWPQFLSASFLAGIGFTISLFFTQAAFTDPGLLATSKLAILIASLVAAGTGWVLLNLTSPRYDEVTGTSEAQPA
jgi:NhaA family Na+:H+ antiporter